MRLGDVSADWGTAKPKNSCTTDEPCHPAGPEGGRIANLSVTKSEPGEHARDPERALARLVRTIEGEIVPRLVLARRVSRGSFMAELPAVRTPDEVDVRELVRLLLAHDAPVAAAYVETVRQRGASLEAVCLHLLAPAARELGLLWEEDECDFMQVTIGLCRLHTLLRELSPEFREEPSDAKFGRNILLAPVPGDQHTFGVTLVAQFLRKAGWQVWHEFPSNAAEILDLVKANWFAVVGFSVGSETRVDDVVRIIRAVRRVSLNPGVGVMVGGPALVVRPELAVLMGADATAEDGPMAVDRAEYICRREGRVNATR